MAVVELFTYRTTPRDVAYLLVVDVSSNVVGSGALAWVWRSPADVVVEVGAMVADGRHSVAAALKNNNVATYVQRLRDRFKVGGEIDDERFVVDYLDCFKHACDTESHGSYYGADSDEPLIDAARALRLPSWARLSLDDGGSIGNAYSQPVVILDRQYVVDDLREQMILTVD